MRVPSISLFPFRFTLKYYRPFFLHQDLLAAAAIGIIGILQAIAYALLAGLPTASAVFSSVIGSMGVALLGGSRYLISGPTTGIALLTQATLASILYDTYDVGTAEVSFPVIAHLLGQLVLLAGLIQIILAFCNVNKLLQFVSRPVILGYFAGISLAILVNQAFYFFGIPLEGSASSLLARIKMLLFGLPNLDIKTTAVGSVCLGILLWKRSHFLIIKAFFILTATSLLNFAFNHWFGEPLTPTLQAFKIHETLYPQLSLPWLDFTLINKLLPAAIAIALLAILETSSLARNFAGAHPTADHFTRINQDVFGLGATNILLSFVFGAMPTSSSATRTALNFQWGAKTPLAALVSGLFMLVLGIFLWPFIEHVPLSSLAALLIAAIPALLNMQEYKFAMKATREDLWVLCLTFTFCLLFSLPIALFLGVMVSIGTYLRRSAVPHVVEYAFNSKGRLMTVTTKEETHHTIRIIGVSGDLFFASADGLQVALQQIAQQPETQVIILRLSNIYHLDASMCLAIRTLHELLSTSQRYLLISGITEPVWQVLLRTGLVKQIGRDNLYFRDESNPQFSTWKACLHAQHLVHGPNPNYGK